MIAQMPPSTPVTVGLVVTVVGIILAVIGVTAWFDKRYPSKSNFEELKRDFEAYVEQRIRDDARREKEDKLFDKLIEAVQNAIRKR